ncbi:MAG TPA: phosphoribosyltransferase family protein, partial [Candidatus Nanoarchaeia archaeon]|nr:phosphoribosyltransferase family protein [Candidatus Nanoarchaeia archaeon]
MPKIVYLGEPRELITALGLSQRADEFLRMLDYFDYAGGVALPRMTFYKHISSLSIGLQEEVLLLAHEHRGIVHLRADNYYLNFRHDADVHSLRTKLVELQQQMDGVVHNLEGRSFESLEDKLIVSSVLDHKKHYALCMFNALFGHALSREVNLSTYRSVQQGCIEDVGNYYRFILTGEVGKQGHYEQEAYDTFKTIDMPKSRVFATPIGTIRESSAEKIIMREMDHPAQILLFAGQVIDQDKHGSFDFVVNPLAGALEIGYALKAIYETLGIPKVNDVLLVKYSKHGEGHQSERSLEQSVPLQLRGDLERIRGKRLCVIDDNTFSGETLKAVREMCRLYSDNVAIAAIERRMDVTEPRVIEYDDLDIKP